MSNKHIIEKKFILLNERKPTWKIAIRISLLYLVIGLFVNIFLDVTLVLFSKGPQMFSILTQAKSVLFVLFSTLLIYIFIKPALVKLSDNAQVIIENRNDLKVMLYYDHLTGLSNRRKLIERLPSFLQDNSKTGKVLLFIDIDDIKLINDTMGHVYGDSLISETSRRLLSILKKPSELYRLGGDEFIILAHFDQIDEVEAMTAQIMKLFESPLLVEKTLIHSTISIGISLYPLHSKDHGELLQFADIAMHQSKKDGKNRAVFFNNLMMIEINERKSIGEYLHDALVNNEFEVYYQPQIDTKTRKIASFESLLRWTNPVLGRVSPDKFIKVAEETHMIISIGEWVLRTSCQFLKSMHTAGFADLSISVNISMLQLLQENFISMVEKILLETELDPSKLELEITESILMESYSLIGNKLEELRNRNIGIALDDFGKGYSSLSYLEQLPITILKIDKIFVDAINEKKKESSLTGNIIRIGKKLGLTVIAEGVETETQLEYLEINHCDKIQGWIFSKALPATEAEAFTRKNREA